MPAFLNEVSREFRRNMRGIADFYSPAPDFTDPYDNPGPLNLSVAFAPVVYLVGAVEPLVESTVRYILNKCRTNPESSAV